MKYFSRALLFVLLFAGVSIFTRRPVQPRALRERRRTGPESGGPGLRNEGVPNAHPARAAQAVRSRSDSFAARGPSETLPYPGTDRQAA